MKQPRRPISLAHSPAESGPAAEWHPRFPDPTLPDATLDPLVRNAYRLELRGGSQRKTRSSLPMPTT